mgnify:CR=1 FL=1
MKKSLEDLLKMKTYNITVNGQIMEPARFTWGIYPIVFIVIFALITNALCWTVRTNALKKIDASVVAVIMPFSAVITAIASVIIGTDKVTLNLVLGGILCLAAAILSDIALSSAVRDPDLPRRIRRNRNTIRLLHRANSRDAVCPCRCRDRYTMCSKRDCRGGCYPADRSHRQYA